MWDTLWDHYKYLCKVYQVEESRLPVRAEGHGEARTSGKHFEWGQRGG